MTDPSRGKWARIAMAFSASLLICGQSNLWAQQAGGKALLVAVTDSSGAPIGGAQVTVAKADNALIASGRTSAGGTLLLRFSESRDSYALTARHIGFAPAARVFTFGTADTLLSVRMVLARVTPVLDTVRAIAAGLSRDKWAYLSADEIENAGRYTPTLGEALRKLRPFIDYQSMKCVGRVRYYVNGVAVPTQPPQLFGPIWTRDFAELRYVNCFDPSIPPNDYPGSPRFYVVLKPGAVYEPVTGTRALTAADRKVPHGR